GAPEPVGLDPVAADALDARPELREGQEVGVDAASADDIASREREEHAAVPGEHRPGKQDRRPAPRREARIDFRLTDFGRVNADLVRPQPFALHAEHPEELEERPDVADVGDVVQHDGLVGEQRRGEHGERGVLVSCGTDRTPQRVAAFDDEFRHLSSPWKRPLAPRPGTYLDRYKDVKLALRSR